MDIKTNIAVSSKRLTPVGACKTRRKFSAVPTLHGNGTAVLHESMAAKNAVLLAMAARKLRTMCTPEIASDLYESAVKMDMFLLLSEEELEICRLLGHAERFARRLLGRELDPGEMKALVISADDERTVTKLVKAHLDEVKYPCEKTRNLNVRSIVAKVMRYLNWEMRIADFGDEKTIRIFNLDVSVAPDMIFDNGLGEITVVKLNSGKPRLKQKGKSASTAVSYNLEMYALWRYGETIANEGDTVIAEAISLTRTDDKSNEMKTLFVEGSKRTNIVDLVCDVAPGKKHEGELHDRFQNLYQQFADGIEVECNPTDCKYCDFYNLCNSKREPQKSEDEFGMKQLKDISLSPDQEKIVFFREGIARVNAGAGAGKTLVMSLFCTTLLDEGVDPSDILCITFTNAGAKELSERIKLYNDDFCTGADASKVVCTTFNGFGAQIIEDQYRELGFSYPPRLVDDIDRMAIIENLLSRYTVSGLDYKTFKGASFNACGALDVASAAFNVIKTSGSVIPTEDLLRHSEKFAKYRGCIYDDRAYEELIDLYYKYEKVLKERNLIEYADQEALLWQLIGQDPYFLENVFPAKYVLVDEFQDTSTLQLELIKQFTYCKGFKGLMVCGDDAQSIFRFRGAVPENMVEFFDRLGVLPGEEIDLPLLDNYRSTEPIIGFANKVIEANRKRVIKSLVSKRGPGKPVTVKGFGDSDAEYEYIASVVDSKLAEGFAPEDIAILASTGAELTSIADALTAHGVSSVLLCPVDALENTKIQAGLALCNMLQNLSNTKDIAIYLNACEIENGGILSNSELEFMNKVSELGEEIATVYRPATPAEKMEFFQKKLDAIDPDENDAIFQDFKSRLDLRHSLRDKFDYAEHFSRYGGQKQKIPGKYPGIVLSTIHSSKGLEWPVVIVSETKLDSKSLSEDDIEEKRRLLFVAATRARDELYLTGKFISYKQKVNPTDKKATKFDNKFLRETFKILGETWNPEVDA